MGDRLETIIGEYHQNIEIYKKLKTDVDDIISTLIEVHNIKISTMNLRIKTEEALRKKVIYKDKYTHLEDITDILGCRIITLFEKDVDSIFQLIDNTFEIVEIVDKRKKSRTNRIEFGYSSLHLVVKFTDSRCQLVEYQKYQDILFEIQLRTVLQHAWAEVEHGLGYKSYYEPPMETKRKLSRLAATLELLDEEFEEIRYDIALYNESMEKEEKIMKTDINRDSLIAYVNSSEMLRDMVHKLAAERHLIIVENPDFLRQQHIIAKLNLYGYQYIHELDHDIQKYKNIIYSIGSELAGTVNFDNTSMNIYSPMMWFSFIPVVRNLISGRENDSDDMLEELIMESFKKNFNSIFELFSERQDTSGER